MQATEKISLNYVLPILTDKSSTLRLQIIGIQMTIDVRQSIAYRIKAKKADKFDLLIKKLSKDNSKPDLQQIAIKYIQICTTQILMYSKLITKSGNSLFNS